MVQYVVPRQLMYLVTVNLIPVQMLLRILSRNTRYSYMYLYSFLYRYTTDTSIYKYTGIGMQRDDL